MFKVLGERKTIMWKKMFVKENHVWFYEKYFRRYEESSSKYSQMTTFENKNLKISVKIGKIQPPVEDTSNDLRLC